MKLVQSIQTKWQAAGPWYKTGLQPIIEIINKWISDQELDTNETGLIFLCKDGGYEACIDLWKMAIEQGVRFVNPAPFPYSLSSSPAGFIAKACNIYGPAIILVEEDAGTTQEELNVYAQQIFLQLVTHLLIVKATLYNNRYEFKASVGLYSSELINTNQSQ